MKQWRALNSDRFFERQNNPHWLHANFKYKRGKIIWAQIS